MTLEELQNIEIDDSNEERHTVNSFVLWLNTRYPLRLDYGLLSTIGDNRFEYKNGILTIYLTKFKNSRSMGPQIFEISDPVIDTYMQKITEYLGHEPDRLLYSYYKGIKPFNSRTSYGIYLSNLLRKYTGYHLTMNDIRKIYESTQIQSRTYSEMTHDEKNEKHRALLHSTNTALQCYNNDFLTFSKHHSDV